MASLAISLFNRVTIRFSMDNRMILMAILPYVAKMCWSRFEAWYIQKYVSYYHAAKDICDVLKVPINKISDTYYTCYKRTLVIIRNNDALYEFYAYSADREFWSKILRP